MPKAEKPLPPHGREGAHPGESILLGNGRRVADLFKGAVERVTEFLASTATVRPLGIDMNSVRQVVSRAAPYLGNADNGTIFYTSELRNAASTIQRALYDIPSARGVQDFQQRIKSHHQFIDDTIWKPLIGKTFLEAVRYHFQREGIHCHTPETLARESEFFVSAITEGDISRFSTFLMWCLKDDPELVKNIMPRLG